MPRVIVEGEFPIAQPGEGHPMVIKLSCYSLRLRDAAHATQFCELSISSLIMLSYNFNIRMFVNGAAPGPGNKQICRKAPVWSSERPMTRGQLLSKRDEFWDTAPAFNGRQEIWQALRAAAECEDTETAQAIMSAVNVTYDLLNAASVRSHFSEKCKR